MTERGWSAVGLKVVGDDDTLWTAAEAARLLGSPELPLSAEEVRQLIRLSPGLKPVGRRRTTPHGRSGRYARVYEAQAFIAAYEGLYRG